MSEIKVKLEEATADQMRAFAESHLGISLPRSALPEAIRAKIRAAWAKDEIIVEAQAEEPAGEMVSAPVTTDSDMVKIIIQRTDDAGGDEPVPVGVNGVVMLIPRGKPVDIPRRYFQALELAVYHRYESLEDGMGIDPVPRKIFAYPFQRIS